MGRNLRDWRRIPFPVQAWKAELRSVDLTMLCGPREGLGETTTKFP